MRGKLGAAVLRPYTVFAAQHSCSQLAIAETLE
jgi:hypothetical protein